MRSRSAMIILLAGALTLACAKTGGDDKAAEPNKADKPAEKVRPPESPAPVAKQKKAPAPAAATDAAPKKPKATEEMREHFTRVTAIRDALISGNLDNAKLPAKALVAASWEEAPDKWKPYIATLKAAADKILGSQDIATAAAAAATMAGQCGTCHQALGAKVTFDAVKAPAEDPGVEAHMQRHHWAAGRLWEGIVGPAEEPWNKGVAMLVEAPLFPDELGAKVKPNEKLGQMAAGVHMIADQAKGAHADKRVALYGTFLGTCSGCHNAIKAAKK